MSSLIVGEVGPARDQDRIGSGTSASCRRESNRIAYRDETRDISIARSFILWRSERQEVTTRSCSGGGGCRHRRRRRRRRGDPSATQHGSRLVIGRRERERSKRAAAEEDIVTRRRRGVCVFYPLVRVRAYGLRSPGFDVSQPPTMPNG